MMPQRRPRKTTTQTWQLASAAQKQTAIRSSDRWKDGKRWEEERKGEGKRKERQMKERNRGGETVMSGLRTGTRTRLTIGGGETG